MKRLLSLPFILLLACAATAQNTQKLSPRLRAMLTASAGKQASARIQSQPIEVLMKLAPDADEQQLAETYGFTVECRIGEVLIVKLLQSQLAALSESADVVRIEAERAPRPMLDKLPSQIGVDKLLKDANLVQAYTGKGVVVGIVDGGFDYIHPFFRDANGTTRIKWAADYMKNTTLTTTEEIMAALHSSDADKVFHGTHVAGIAAGSAVEDADFIAPVTYRGVAWEADIAEGAVDTELTSEGLSSVSSVKAFNDIFTWAEEQGKPCVINYSMGDAQSLVDSRQLEEEAIRTLLQKPGRALVVASGNSGGTKRLAHKLATMQEAGAGIYFNEMDQFANFFGVELKVQPSQTIVLRYMDDSYASMKGELTVTAKELETMPTLPLGDRNLSVVLRQQSDDYDVFYLSGGMTTFETSERILVTVQGSGDAWIYSDILCAPLENVSRVENHSISEDGYSVAWPASMDEVVAVGNTAHRFKILTASNKYNGTDSLDMSPYEWTKGVGYLAKSSSVGPTLKGSMRPDVCVPGVNIVSAENFFIDDNTYYYYVAASDVSVLDTDMEEHGGMGGFFHVMALTGTSMSAPAVAGTIALWMQADPQLTTEKIKDIFAHSSRQPDSELTYPNNLYGYGEIDAYKGLLYLLGTDGIAEISDRQPAETQIRLNGSQLSIAFSNGFDGAFTVKVYSTDGRQLLAVANAKQVDLGQLPKGVYAVQVTTGLPSTTGSTLIRL